MYQKQKRQRGLLLSVQGLQRLQDAKQHAECHENGNKRFTLEHLSSRTGLDSHTLCKILNHTAKVDRKSLAQCFRAFNLSLEPNDYKSPLPQPFVELETQTLKNRKETALDRQADNEPVFSKIDSTSKHRTQRQYCSDDGSTPDVSIFYGRTTELAILHQWIQVDRCRLVALAGQGGIGKTSLAAKLVEQIQDDFEYVIWRSLHQAPSINELLIQLIQFISQTVNAEAGDVSVTTPLHRLIAQAIDALRSYRCLLILDNVETLLQGCDPKQGVSNLLSGQYCPDYEGYKLFLKRVTETTHQSCLVLTSREIPDNIRQRVGKNLPIRSLPVKGLHVSQIQAIFKNKGAFLSTPDDWSTLVEFYVGNPLILKQVARTILILFGGNITEFLKQDILLFGETTTLLNQQLERVSDVETDILLALAKQAQPGSFSELRSQVTASISNQLLLEGLNSLDMRSLLEINDGYFSLLPLLANAITMRRANGTVMKGT